MFGCSCFCKMNSVLVVIDNACVNNANPLGGREDILNLDFSKLSFYKQCPGIQRGDNLLDPFCRGRLIAHQVDFVQKDDVGHLGLIHQQVGNAPIMNIRVAKLCSNRESLQQWSRYFVHPRAALRFHPIAIVEFRCFFRISILAAILANSRYLTTSRNLFILLTFTLVR